MSFHIAVNDEFQKDENPVCHNPCPGAHGGRLTTIPSIPLDKEK